jgi:BNR repeat-like domain
MPMFNQSPVSGDQTTAPGVAETLTDSAGGILAQATDDGDYYNAISGIGVGAWLRNVSRYYDNNPAQAAFRADSIVFNPGDNGFNYRSPSICKINDTTYLLAVLLLPSGSGDDFTDTKVGVATATLNKSSGAITASPLRVVVAPPTGYAAANPVVCCVRGGRYDGRIVMLFSANHLTAGQSLSEIFGHQIASMYSDDQGVTWSTPVVLPAAINGANPNEGRTTNTCQKIEQIRRGKYAGRLITTVYKCPTDRGQNTQSFVVYSDDQGATWSVGATFDYGGRLNGRSRTLLEVACAESVTGALVFFGRSFEQAYHYVAFSYDGGATLVNEGFDNRVKDSYFGINAPVLQLAEAYTKRPPALLVCNHEILGAPGDTTNRKNLTVRLSHDDMGSYGPKYSLYDTTIMTGYVAAEYAHDDRFILFYEKSPPATLNSSATLVCTVMNTRRISA